MRIQDRKPQVRSARILALVGSLALGAPLYAQSTRPAFTPGPSTTLIDAPRNADGTINYLPAINELIGEGVTSENNAAIILLRISSGTSPHDAAVRKALGLPGVSAENIAPLDYFLSYLSKKTGKEDQLPPLDEWLQQRQAANDLYEHPWKRSEKPDAAAWLQQSEPALAVIEEACRRPRCFLPFASDADPPSLFESVPDIGSFLCDSQVLGSRAMMKAGGDLHGALEDLRRIRTLARFLEQEHVSLAHLVALSTEMVALRGYAGLATSGRLSGAELKALRAEIESEPDISLPDDRRAKVEELCALDLLMDCMRGNSQTIMRLMGWDIENRREVDLGDWARPDWDAALSETVRIYEQVRANPPQTFAENMDQLSKRERAAVDEHFPSWLPEIEGDKVKDKMPEVEAFLKMRPGETRDTFSRRVARWLVGGNPADQKRMVNLDEREQVTRELALLAVDLAEFRASHGAYPEKLADLGKPAPKDPFGNGDLQYTRNESNFELKSVGMNSDGIVIRSAPIP
jgi:hypothetical protein